MRRVFLWAGTADDLLSLVTSLIAGMRARVFFAAFCSLIQKTETENPKHRKKKTKMKTNQKNTVVVAYFLATNSIHRTMQSLAPVSKSAIRSLRKLVEAMLRKRLKDSCLKPKQVAFRLMTSPEEVGACHGGTPGSRHFFIVPTEHISGSKTMAPFQGKAKYGTSSNCSGTGVQVNVHAFGAACPERRRSLVRQIVDWIIAWYKQEYESQSVSPVLVGHVLRPATPWSNAYTVPVPVQKASGHGRRSRWKDRRIFKSAAFA
jgi:hypothetical protein